MHLKYLLLIITNKSHTFLLKSDLVGWLVKRCCDFLWTWSIWRLGILACSSVQMCVGLTLNFFSKLIFIPQTL